MHNVHRWRAVMWLGLFYDLREHENGGITK